jgi:hypothetical protein
MHIYTSLSTKSAFRWQRGLSKMLSALKPAYSCGLVYQVANSTVIVRQYIAYCTAIVRFCTRCLIFRVLVYIKSSVRTKKSQCKRINQCLQMVIQNISKLESYHCISKHNKLEMTSYSVFINIFIRIIIILTFSNDSFVRLCNTSFVV